MACDRALGADPTVREISWSVRDVLLYHLSLGAGRDADGRGGPWQGGEQQGERGEGDCQLVAIHPLG